MPNQEQFDRVIREGLAVKASSIAVSEGLGQRVSKAVLSGEKRRAAGAGSPGWKKIAAAAACMVFAVTGMMLAASPGMQAAASEKAGQIVNKIQVIMHTKEVNGSVMTSSEIVFQDESARREAQEVMARNREKAGGSASFPYATLAEAERAAGFKIKTPAYLPAGYKIPQTIFVGEYTGDKDGKPVKTGKHDVYMRFDAGEESFQGMMLIISELGMEFKPGFKYDNLKVGGRDTRWYESHITLQEEGKEPAVVTERALGWSEGGITYLLTDCSGLTQNELVKMVESMR
jgi:hypothetical protein